jgi:hypothetical protein
MRGPADGLWNESEVEVLMHSPSRDPEEPLGGPLRSPLVTFGRSDAELAAIALLCLVFAWPAEQREQSQPRSDSQ